MQKKINIYIYILLSSLVVLFLILFIWDYNKPKEYTKIFNYFDTNILIKIYTNQNGKEILEEIESIYQKYSKVVDKTQSYEEYNLYDIVHNYKKDEYLTIEKELYDLIKYGVQEYKNTNGIIDISKGNVIDLWKSYFNIKSPTYQELSLANNQNISDIILIGNNQISNNHINIDISSIIKPYLNEKIKEFLSNKNITDYFIYTKDTILLGDKKDSYKVYLEEVNKTLKIKNKAIIILNYQINFNTLQPSDYMKSVTVIADNSNEANKVAHTLFQMEVEKGKEYIESLENVEAIFIQNDGQVLETSGIIDFTKNT